MTGARMSGKDRAAKREADRASLQRRWVEIELPRMKRAVMAEVERRVLTSFMNDTRWRELRDAVETLPFPPVFQRQDVLGPREPLWASDQMSCFGDWSHEGLEPFFMIEWIRVVPKLWAWQGQLIPMKQVGDCTVELREALDRLRLPYREDGRGFWIYGYAPGDPSTLTGPSEGAT
jgi:hypothetical protein